MISNLNKRCSHCKTEKLVESFNKWKYGKDGLMNICRECRNKIRKIDYHQNRDKMRKSKMNWYWRNRDKDLKNQKEYYKKNSDKIKQRSKSYYQSNKQRAAESSKEYRGKNKEIIKQRKLDHYNSPSYQKHIKQKRKSNWQQEKQQKFQAFCFGVARFPQILKILVNHWQYRKEQARIALNIRSRIKKVVKSHNATKNIETNSLLGCTFVDYRKYLESLFDSEMSWDNYGCGPGKWQIDHIKPCILFNLQDPKEQKQCFHYSNTRPLWYKEHIKKTLVENRLKSVI